MEIFEQLILFPGLFLYVVVTSIRVWFLWYDLNVSKLQLQRAWRVALNPNSESQDWYFQNQNIWGNPYLILKYGIVYAIIFSIVTITLYLNDLNLYKWLVALFCLLVEVVWVLLMWLKMRKFYYDNLGIKKEFLYFWIVVFIFITIGAIGTVLIPSQDRIHTEGYNMHSCSSELFWACFILCLVNCLIFGLIPLPKWFIARDKLQEKLRFEARKQERNSIATTTMTNKSQNGYQTEEDIEKQRIESKWSKIIVTDFGYESFMSHLTREFSIENFLFVTEVCLLPGLQSTCVVRLQVPRLVWQNVCVCCCFGCVHFLTYSIPS